MSGLYLLSVWIHLLAATAWIGAMLFFAVVVVPSLRDPGVAPSAPAVLRAVGKRYRIFGQASLAILVVTGVSNLLLRGFGWTILTNASFWQMGFGRTLAHKLVAVAGVIVATVMHDVWMGARATKLITESPASPEARALRRRASVLGRLTLILSLAVLFFAVELVRGAP